MNRPSEPVPLHGADAAAHEQAARRASDQIDPYALIERAEKLIDTSTMQSCLRCVHRVSREHAPPRL